MLITIIRADPRGPCSNVPVMLTWTNTGPQVGRQYKVRTWWDGLPQAQDGTPSWAEPIRIAYVNVLKVDIVPDFNHDRKIDESDKTAMSTNGPYRFWINDNQELSDADGHDWPGCDQPDWKLDHANGVRDLVDFFPVYLDIGQALQFCPTNQYRYILKQADNALKGVPTRLHANSEDEDWKPEAYQIRPYIVGVMTNAVLQVITNSGVEITGPAMDQAVELGAGIVMVLEGTCATTNPLVLEIRQRTSDLLVAKSEMPLSLSSVTNMFRFLNLRSVCGAQDTAHPTQTNEPPNYPDLLCNRKHLVYTHGFNEDENDACGDLCQVFKRFYWSGSQAKFTGVSWYGSDYTPLDLGLVSQSTYYHTDVIHAFQSASNYAAYVSSLQGEVQVAAYSLGNMMVSSAIQDWGAHPAKYYMIHCAVAKEAYDGNERATNMIHDYWVGYTNCLYASEWYSLFSTNDNRSKLSWRGRFANVVNDSVYNFYSSEDDVLDNIEIQSSPGSAIFTNLLKWLGGLFSGGSDLKSLFRRFAWAYQELYKGRHIEWLGGSTFGGWGFTSDNHYHYGPDSEGNYGGIWEASTANVQAATMDLKEVPFFDSSGLVSPLLADPTNPFGACSVAATNLNPLLATAFPATSQATGRNPLTKLDFYGNRNFNMDNMKTSPDQWPRYDAHPLPGHKQYPWYHGDHQAVAYVFLYQLYDTMCGLGGLKQ